ncbi:MAG TPA: SpoIIE family protein phosphatase [Methylomirabilota bacterium]|nr:SpoIIE family protein phosphatase [Methylomirabilota bacterium]
MAALVSKLAITVMLALAWRNAGGPIEPVALRRRLAWGFGLAIGLRLALELLMRVPSGAARDATAFVALLVALAFLWPLLQLALVGPLKRAGRITRLVFTAVGLIVLWVAEPGTSMFFFWLAFTRYAWPRALATPERFLVSVASLVMALALFIGARRPEALGPVAHAAGGIAWSVRDLALVYALLAVPKAFNAFTSDPTLGIRRVSRRLVLSHVLVLGVPLAIVVTLWICSTYLGVNAERALMTVRALDRETTRLEESLRIACGSGDAVAGARALAEGRSAHWPSLRTYAVTDTVVERVQGGSLPQEAKVAGWVAGLDSLPDHGVVELGGVRYLGAAVKREAIALVALEPVAEAFDSTLSPLMGAEVRLISGSQRPSIPDSMRVIERRAGPRARWSPEARGASVNVGDDTLSNNDLGRSFGFTGSAIVAGVRRDFYSWKSDQFAISARASFHATLAGLFVHLRENPLQIVPVLALALLAFTLLPLVNTDFKMVRGMGGSITRAIGALREGAAAFGEGKLAHRIPIAGDDDLWDTARQFNRMAEGLERARELEKERDRLEHELDLARRIQARLLPAAPPRVNGLDVAGLSESAREVGGDYFDHLDLGEGRLLLVIADVSGKGVPAALLMSGFRAALMSQDLAQLAPVTIAGRVNEFLTKSVEPGRFVTAFLGLVDASSGRLTYVNAGHNPPLLLRSGGAVEWLEAGGVILGIMPDVHYTGGETTLAPGDLVALYTDGVTEGANAANEMWGEARLTTLLQSVATGRARDIATRIVRDVRTFEGERGPADDITVLVAKRVPAGPA